MLKYGITNMRQIAKTLNGQGLTQDLPFTAFVARTSILRAYNFIIWQTGSPQTTFLNNWSEIIWTITPSSILSRICFFFLGRVSGFWTPLKRTILPALLNVATGTGQIATGGGADCVFLGAGRSLLMVRELLDFSPEFDMKGWNLGRVKDVRHDCPGAGVE